MKIDSAILYVKDLDESIGFFCNQLNFNLEFKDSSRYASFIFDDKSKLGVIQVNEKEKDNPGHNAVKFRIKDATALYTKLKKQGLKFSKDLTIESWAIEFIVLDIDGNKLIMAERN